MENEKISVKLEVFEGPLELLLHLLKKNKVSIYDIPIVKITEQYFAYLDQYKEFDIELFSEFLIMAAELLLIKSKMLLPKHEEQEEEDPRGDLVERLLQYQRIKMATEFLKDNEFATRFNYFKEPDAIDKPAPDYSGQAFDIELLMEAFLIVMDKTERKAPPPKKSFEGIVGHEKVSITSRATYIKERLRKDRKVHFESLFEGLASRPTIIATFLALLEMMKLEIVLVTFAEKEITITQIKDGDITDEF